ncbi:SDR family oxidoreductase [Leeuwenhoekiella blandensis]|uniref:YhfK n=1 Tax=Leeuwenhoekiella blandensis (strain CECT 7118 / CCUG 51940 / KCTC 22103 / MED217) TaxID=398720 RepID=A3XMZ9_LEEBM|nr:SDR family oxidoreductase [Leeuwenhoekiella blandensis]EAQ49080.1 YhfK [Leeuwenhoekiella blandensis MED217]
MKVLIIGAHGKVGQRISKAMRAAEDVEPTAFIRKEEQKPLFEEMGVDTVVESLENTPEAIGEVIKNYDAIVFSAGSGGNTGDDKTIEIDLDGAIKVINEAEKHNIKRFVMVSASQVDNRSYWGKVDGMKPYFTAKYYADLELKRSSLDYTILRPVLLTDEDEAGKVLMTETPDEVGSEIPRQAVAETVLTVLKDPKTYGKVIEMSKGEDKIADALAKVC